MDLDIRTIDVAGIDLREGMIVGVNNPQLHRTEIARIVELLRFNPAFTNISARTADGRRKEGEVANTSTVVVYVADEVSCGWVSDANATLSELDGVAYRISEDPKYEWLGEVQYRHADGITHGGDADADQNVVLTSAGYDWIFDAAEGDPVGIAVRVAQHFMSGLVKRWYAAAAKVDELPEAERTLRPIEVDA